RWVYRTIALTDAYQRAIPSEQQQAELPSVATASPTRLRGDQLYNSVTQVLGRPSLAGSFGRGGGMMVMRGPSRDAGRFAFGQLFNYDPSTPQIDLTGNIPQALFMM